MKSYVVSVEHYNKFHHILEKYVIEMFHVTHLFSTKVNLSY